MPSPRKRIRLGTRTRVASSEATTPAASRAPATRISSPSFTGLASRQPGSDHARGEGRQAGDQEEEPGPGDREIAAEPLLPRELRLRVEHDRPQSEDERAESHEAGPD